MPQSLRLRKPNSLHGDALVSALLRGLCIIFVILFISILIGLVIESWPSIKQFGIAYLYQSHWSPVDNHFGALNIILGTIITAIIAMVIAIPLSFGIAITINELLSKRLSSILARMIELMAGIPSIIYGMWGLFTFVPFMATYIQPTLIQWFAHRPILHFIFSGLPIGISIFTAGIVLAIMVVPLISSMMRDILANTPVMLRESAYAVGATHWEVAFRILLPYTRKGMLGSIILGFGRALGETMAVTFVIGNSHGAIKSLFMPGTTISATIANEFTEATGKLYSAALIELGLILFAITFVALLIARILLKKSSYHRGGIQ